MSLDWSSYFRPRSASVGNIESADLDDFIDLPNGKPLTERRVPSSRNSEIEINQLFGSSKEINIFVGTWNLNLSTNINTGKAKTSKCQRVVGEAYNCSGYYGKFYLSKS